MVVGMCNNALLFLAPFLFCQFIAIDSSKAVLSLWNANSVAQSQLSQWAESLALINSPEDQFIELKSQHNSIHYQSATNQLRGSSPLGIPESLKAEILSPPTLREDNGTAIKPHDHNVEKNEEEVCTPPEFDEVLKDQRLYHTPEEMVEKGLTFDVIIIPSGGLDANGEPYGFVKTRLDWAGRFDQLHYNRHHDNVTKHWISSGAWSPLKAVVLSKTGHPVGEGRVDASYLVNKWNIRGRMIVEEQSKDSLGNAFFSRILTDHLKAKRILLVTNHFQMPRMKLTFDWVMSLLPKSRNIELFFLQSPNIGMTEEEATARIEKEKQSIKHFYCKTRPSVKSMRDLTSFIYFSHQAYAFDTQNVKYDANITMSDALLKTY